jgi:hypothetical protein
MIRRAAEVVGGKLEIHELRTHRTIEEQDPLAEQAQVLREWL